MGRRVERVLLLSCQVVGKPAPRLKAWRYLSWELSELALPSGTGNRGGSGKGGWTPDPVPSPGMTSPQRQPQSLWHAACKGASGGRGEGGVGMQGQAWGSPQPPEGPQEKATLPRHFPAAPHAVLSLWKETVFPGGERGTVSQPL